MSKGKRMASREEQKIAKKKRKEIKKRNKKFAKGIISSGKRSTGTFSTRRKKREEEMEKLYEEKRENLRNRLQSLVNENKVDKHNLKREKARKDKAKNINIIDKKEKFEQEKIKNINKIDKKENKAKKAAIKKENKKPVKKKQNEKPRSDIFSYELTRNQRILESERQLNKVKIMIVIVVFIITILTTTIILNKKGINIHERITGETTEADSKVNNDTKIENSTDLEENKTEIADSAENKQILIKSVEETEDEQIKELVEKEIEKQNNPNKKFAFFYWNMNTNKYYFYNENEYITAASTYKLPLAMLYYDRIRSGKIKSDAKFTYSKDAYEEGAGSTNADYKVGDKIPVSYLLEQSIINSDNTASNILIRNIGYKKYRKNITEYTDIEEPNEFYKENITSAKFSYEICKYLYEHKQDYEKLIEDLKKSSKGSYLKKYLTDIDVAHKYGSIDDYTHDYGIVFGKNTYLVGVFTKGFTDAEEFIANLSSKVFEIEESESDDNTNSKLYKIVEKKEE